MNRLILRADYSEVSSSWQRMAWPNASRQGANPQAIRRIVEDKQRSMDAPCLRHPLLTATHLAVLDY